MAKKRKSRLTDEELHWGSRMNNKEKQGLTDEELQQGFEASFGIMLYGGNTRVQKEEIYAIFEAAKAKAKTMHIGATMEGMIR